VLYLISSVKILAEYERGVIFRLGKLLPQPKGPGVILVFAPIDRIVRVSLRTVAFEVPPQDVITRDNVSVKVSAVLYYRVVDPRRAIVAVENYQYATLQLAQTTLRSVLGQAQLDDLLAERDRLNQQLQHFIQVRDYRQATRYLYLISLTLLNGKGLIQWHKDATNQEYLLQLKGSSLETPFRYLTGLYDKVWYGEFPLGETQFNRLHQYFEDFYKTVPA